MPPCVHCGRPAVHGYPSDQQGVLLPLCVEHSALYHQTMQKEQEAMERHMDFLADRVDETWGVGRTGARFREQPRARPQVVQMAKPVFNNIHVSGDNLGVINTGAIRDLDLRVQGIRERGQAEFADALARVVEQVTRAGVDDVRKREAIDLLNSLSDEAVKPVERRSAVVLRTLATALDTTLSTAANAVTAWPALQAIIQALS